MKKHFLLGLLACSIISCDNQDANDFVGCGTTFVKYVYKGIEYTVEMRELSDGSFEEVSELAPELEHALSLPAPYFVQDSLDTDKFYVYDSVPQDVKINDEENDFVGKHGRHMAKAWNDDEYDNAGLVYTFDRANYLGNLCVFFTVRESNFNARMMIDGKNTQYWGIRYLSVYGVEDKITSIMVYANKSGQKCGYFNIRFFEDPNYEGSCIELKCHFMDALDCMPTDEQYICDMQANLNKVIRKKRFLRKNITWDDRISSLYYYYKSY